MVPAPAINGKASGTIDAELASSSRYMRIPKIISNARKNKTKDPATAKEFTSIPIKFKSSSPTNRKVIMMKPDTKDAFSDSICPNFDLKSMMMGMDPMMSITAKSTIPTVMISLRSNPIIAFFDCKVKLFGKLSVKTDCKCYILKFFVKVMINKFSVTVFL